MDTNYVLDDNVNNDDLVINRASIQYLGETARWAKFLAIVGFVFVGLMVIASFFIGTVFSSMNELNSVYPGTDMGMFGKGMGVFMTIFYLIFAAIYFFPCLFLYRFASKTQMAIRQEDTIGLSDGLKNMKNYFQFCGILMAIFLGLYALMFVGGIFGGLLAM